VTYQGMLENNVTGSGAEDLMLSDPAGQVIDSVPCTTGNHGFWYAGDNTTRPPWSVSIQPWPATRRQLGHAFKRGVHNGTDNGVDILGTPGQVTACRNRTGG